MRGLSYWRTGIDRRADLLVRANATGNLYRETAFNDYAVALQAGPQYRSGQDRLSFSGSTSWRWYGGKPYTFSYGINGNWQHPIDTRTQLRADGAITHVDDRLNDLRDADRFSAKLSLDRSVSPRFGGGVSLSGYRQAARDAGYSTTSGGIDAYLFREMGRTTAVASVGYDHLEADARLFLYPRRRVDNRFEASLSATFRGLRVGAFAPLAKVTFENNVSTIEIYNYHRVAAEFGVAAAF